jgi:hypothetical protein
VTVPRRVLAAVPFPSAAGWAGRGVGNGAAASPDSWWLAASRRGARDFPTQERVAGGAVASPEIHRRRGEASRGWGGTERSGDGQSRGRWWQWWRLDAGIDGTSGGGTRRTAVVRLQGPC